MSRPLSLGRAVAASVVASGTLSLLCALPLTAQSAHFWRSVGLSRQLRDSAPQRIRVQYGAGQVDVRPALTPVLYDMHLRYDERRATPLHKYDADLRTTVLGLESFGEDARNVGGTKDFGELRVGLPSSVPLDL